MLPCRLISETDWIIGFKLFIIDSIKVLGTHVGILVFVCVCVHVCVGWVVSIAIWEKVNIGLLKFTTESVTCFLMP
jgi:hypothetical protein